MKKALGKKAHMQDGTMVAFATCNCSSKCKSYTICNCTTDPSAYQSTYSGSYAKLMTTAVSGSNFQMG